MSQASVTVHGEWVFAAEDAPRGVDWPQARLSLPESLAKNFSAVVETVAAVSKGRKARMRAKVRRIYDECMATDAKVFRPSVPGFVISSFLMPSNIPLKCGCTFGGFLAWPRISSKSSLEMK